MFLYESHILKRRYLKNIAHQIKIIFAIGICSPNPCRNGGNCMVTLDGKPKCYCTVGWAGENCTLGTVATQLLFILR